MKGERSALHETACKDIVSYQKGIQREHFGGLYRENRLDGPETAHEAVWKEGSTTAAGDSSCRLAIISTTTLRGLLIVLSLLDFLGQPFLFAQLLETPEHLFDTLAATGLDSNRHLVKFLTLR